MIHQILRRRKIIPEHFYSRFPELFVQIATVPVTKAEEALGMGAIDDLVKTEESNRTVVEHLE